MACSTLGITQEQINETRSTRENQIIKEVQVFLDSGGDIETRDNVGATLVSHVSSSTISSHCSILSYFLH